MLSDVIKSVDKQALNFLTLDQSTIATDDPMVTLLPFPLSYNCSLHSPLCHLCLPCHVYPDAKKTHSTCYSGRVNPGALATMYQLFRLSLKELEINTGTVIIFQWYISVNPSLPSFMQTCLPHWVSKRGAAIVSCQLKVCLFVYLSVVLVLMSWSGIVKFAWIKSKSSGYRKAGVYCMYY